MIKVQSINGDPLYINPDMVETMRVTPDTVLFLNNGKRILVKDTPEEVIDRIVEYRRRIFGQYYNPGAMLGAAGEPFERSTMHHQVLKEDEKA